MSPANTRDPKFQSYLDNIEAKTGKKPADLVRLAKAKGLLDPKVKVASRWPGCRRISAWDVAMRWRSW